MWDFSIGRTLSILLRTWPFTLLRLVVYFAITAAYVLGTGAGAGIGYGAGHATGDADGPVTFALWGAIGGFGIVSIAVYWAREYILYMVKAGHVAVIAHLVDNVPLPEGQQQVAYAQRIVRERFVEANVLFVADQLVKGAVAAVTGLLGGFAAILPIPGLQGLVRFANTVVRLSLTYVDEVIIGYAIRNPHFEPFEAARRGVILYAQNGRRLVKNAVWLAIFIWIVTIALFFLMLAPAAAILYAMPGQLAGWAFVLAIVFAWALKAALIEPFAIAALMEVYFRAIEGQEPDPEWDARLERASARFRSLKDRAMVGLGGRAQTAP